MTMLQRVLSIQPERADVKSELLDLYTQLGYNFEAVELAKKLLDKSPRDLEALRAKARGLAASQKSEEALTVCKEFNAIVPLDLEMRILSLEVLRDLRRRPQILDQVQDLLAKYPNDGKVEVIAAFAFTLVEEIPETQRQQLTELLKTRYPTQEPLRILDPFRFSQFLAMQASQRDLSDLVFVRYLIDQLDTTRLVAKSLEVLQKVDAQQETPWVRNLLVSRLWESGQFAEVIKRLEKLDLKGATAGEVEMLAMRGIAQARSDLQGPAAATAKTLANVKNDRFAQAWSTVLNELFLTTNGNALQVIDSINFALELQRNNPYLRFFLGLAYLQLGERDAGYEAIAQVVAARPLWQLRRVKLSRMKLEAGQKRSALEDASEALAINQTIAVGGNYAIIKAANIEASDVKANSDLLDIVAIIQKQAPGDELTLPLYVQLLARTNQVAQAKTIVNSALSSEKQIAVTTFLRLASVSRAANLGLEEACFAAAEKSGLTPEVAVARASALAESGDIEGAVKYFQDSMQKSGAADVAWRLALAGFLEQIKNDRAAATWIALADDPALKMNLIVQHQALSAASAQKDSAFIFRTIERIRAVSGDKSIGWKLAQARLRLRDPSANKTELIKTMNDIVSGSPNNVDARALLAAAYENEKSPNIPAALEQLIAARKLQPASKSLNLELARLYAAQLDFQRSREILLSIPRDSLDPAQRRVAARLSGQQGDIDTAIGFAEGAQADAPPLDRLYLAELYRRVKQDAKAEAIYKSLLEKPNHLEVVMAAADFYASRGKKELAMLTLANLEKLSLRPGEKDFAMAEYSARHGDANQALASYLAVVATEPTKFNGWRALVSEYLRMGKPDQAV